MSNNLTILKKYSLQSIEQAVSYLNKGKCLIFPTETFFALGCKISHIQAVQKIFLAKQRPPNIPLPVIIGNKKQLSTLADVPEKIKPLLEHFWPGPLTIVVHATNNIPCIVHGNTNTIAVRLTSHPLAQKLAQLAGEPLIATSANLHKNKPTTKDSELDLELFTYADGIISQPPEPIGGLPSTIIKVQDDGGIIILRDGAITKEQIHTAIQKSTLLHF